MNEEVMIPKSYHDKVCEAMARRHQAEMLELTKDRQQGECKDVPPNAWEFNGIIQWRECSVCKCRSMFISNYCPHCGARMKGADDESVDVL